MDKEYEIRLANQSDIQQIAELYVESWNRTYQGLIPQSYLNNLTVGSLCKRWGDYIKEPKQGIFVAVNHKKVLGFGAFKPYHRIDDCIYVDSLHVNKSFQGKGIGSAIINKIYEVGKEQSYGKMSICIVKGNDRARELYVKLGAKHFRDKVDDFTGETTYSEILTWDL